MKKVIILLVAVFVHLSGYSNTTISTECIDPSTHEELIEKLSNTDEIKKLVKLSYAHGLLKMKEKAANEDPTIIMTTEDKENYNKIYKNYEIIVNKIATENPSLKEMDIKEVNNVFNNAISKTVKSNKSLIVDAVECLGSITAAGNSCSIRSASSLNKTIYYTCLVTACAADIKLGIDSGGTLFFEIEPIVAAEVGFCAALSFGASTAVCLVSSISTVVTCIMTAFDLL